MKFEEPEANIQARVLEKIHKYDGYRLEVGLEDLMGLGLVLGLGSVLGFGLGVRMRKERKLMGNLH